MSSIFFLMKFQDSCQLKTLSEDLFCSFDFGEMNSMYFFFMKFQYSYLLKTLLSLV